MRGREGGAAADVVSTAAPVLPAGIMLPAASASVQRTHLIVRALVVRLVALEPERTHLTL